MIRIKPHSALLSLGLLTASFAHAQVPPTASANFSPSTVEGGGTKTTTYTLTVSNPNASDLTNLLELN